MRYFASIAFFCVVCYTVKVTVYNCRKTVRDCIVIALTVWNDVVYCCTAIIAYYCLLCNACILLRIVL